MVRVFLTGVSCVGRTTIGRRLSELLGVGFFDLDEEIEKFFGTSIERLQNRFITMHSFREEAGKAVGRHYSSGSWSRHSVRRPRATHSGDEVPRRGATRQPWPWAKVAA